MKNDTSLQKKKTLANTIARVVFKILVAIAVVLFAYIIIDRTNFSTPSMSIGPAKKTSSNSDVPSSLRWFDDFKGVENVPDKQTKKSSTNKKDSSSSSSSGFKFEGFKK